jgi:hypothetical protein
MFFKSLPLKGKCKMEGSVLDSGKGSYFYFIVRSSVTWINNVKLN